MSETAFFLSGFVPTLTLNPADMGNPWILPDDYARPHRDRLAVLVFGALGRNPSAGWPLVVEWEALENHRPGLRHAASDCLVWWKLPSGVSVLEVRNALSDLRVRWALLDFEDPVGVHSPAWLQVVKRALRSAVVAGLDVHPLVGRQPPGAPLDPESLGLHEAAMLYESPVDLLDYTNEVLAERFRGASPSEAHARAHGLVMARRFLEAGLDREALDALLTFLCGGLSERHPGLAAAGFLDRTSERPTALAALLRQERVRRAFLQAISLGDESREKGCVSRRPVSGGGPRDAREDGMEVQGEISNGTFVRGGNGDGFDAIAIKKQAVRALNQLEISADGQSVEERVAALENLVTAASAFFRRETAAGRWWSDAMREAAHWAIQVLNHAGPEQPVYQATRADALFLLGNIGIRGDRYEEADRYLKAALDLNASLERRSEEANCLKALGDLYLRRASLDSAAQCYRQALPLYRRMGGVLGEANCLKGLGNVHLNRSEHDQALECYRAALPLYRKVGATLGEANGLKSLGNVHLVRGEVREAGEAYEKALEIYRSRGAQVGVASCLHRLGECYRRLDQLRRARKVLHEALRIARESDSIATEGNVLTELARCEEKELHWEAAADLHRQALGCSRRLNELRSVYVDLESLIEALRRTGKEVETGLLEVELNQVRAQLRVRGHGV